MSKKDYIENFRKDLAARQERQRRKPSPAPRDMTHRERGIYEEQLRESERKFEQAEKGIFPFLKFKFTFNQIGTMFRNVFKKAPLLILPLLLVACKTQYASVTAPGGIKMTYLDNQIGGYSETDGLKVDQNGISIEEQMVDNEKSLSHTITGAVTYGVADIAGGVLDNMTKADSAADLAGIQAGTDQAQIAADQAAAAAKAEAAAAAAEAAAGEAAAERAFELEKIKLLNPSP